MSQRGSYSADAALQMWRIESTLILIGDENPREEKFSQSRTRLEFVERSGRK